MRSADATGGEIRKHAPGSKKSQGTPRILNKSAAATPAIMQLEGLLPSRLEEAKKASLDGGALLDGFAGCIYNTGRISINMRPSVLTDLVARRKYQNIYEWANEHATLSSRSVADILREKLGRYYERRVYFDDSFENGRAFRYGLLNIGGVGADRYGQFCIVLKADFVRADTSVAYLKG